MAAITTSPPALLTAIDSNNHIHLIVGSNSLAAARVSRSLEVGATPILIAPPTTAALPHILAARVQEKKISWLQREFSEQDLTTLGRPEVENVVDAVFVTSPGSTPANIDIAAQCRRLRIPVNVVDAPQLCTFTLLSTHSAGPLQIGVTTSGRGCKLASRIRREIAAALPPDLGDAVDRLGAMRRKIWEQDRAAQATKAGQGQEKGSTTTSEGLHFDPEDDEAGQTAAFNKLVLSTDTDTAKARRMRWLAQICEYWPLQRLAAITDDDVTAVLEAYQKDSTSMDTTAASTTISPLPSPRTRRAQIILAGSGPGHPDLLTTATLKALRSADVILADKLVPAGVLALAPRRTPLHIARKFPGNADAAQDELHSLALAALRRGQSVLRLKQGDPYLYGRGAEEVAFFRSHGFEPLVLPGVTSALSAPLFAGIPPTHRAVADQVLICTGTGRHGAKPPRPPYREAQTVVFLMALHRLGDLVESLTVNNDDSNNNVADAENPVYPLDTPCAVIERASCPDQRVLRSTLRWVVEAVEVEGSRPPGLIVVGRACEVLFDGEGEILKGQEGKELSASLPAEEVEQATAGGEEVVKEKKRNQRQKWIVEEGWRGLDGLETFGSASSASSSTVLSPELHPDPKQAGAAEDSTPALTPDVGHDHQSLILGRSGLHGLREMLLSPGLVEKGDPMLASSLTSSTAGDAVAV
jgi:uroporphyrin-III C-methyltransferase